MPIGHILTCSTPFAASSPSLHGLDDLPMALSVPGMTQPLYSCQCKQHVLSTTWSKRGRNVLLRARSSAAVLKPHLCSFSGFARTFGTSLKIEDLSFGETSSRFDFFKIYFKTLSVHFPILGAVVLSQWQTGELSGKSSTPEDGVKSAFFTIIVVVTGLSAFINASVWTYTCAISSFPAKKKIRNEALGYSELPCK